MWSVVYNEYTDKTYPIEESIFTRLYDYETHIAKNFHTKKEAQKYAEQQWKVIVACGIHYFVVPQGESLCEDEVLLKEGFRSIKDAEKYLEDFIASVDKHEENLKNLHSDKLNAPNEDAPSYMYGDLEPSTNNEKASSFPYKYNEGNVLKELEQYFQGTYGEHYSSKRNNVQTLEYIMDNFEDGKDFLKGCALKYLCRYGKKGGNNRKDLLKAIHYIIFMMYYEDNNNNKESD